MPNPKSVRIEPLLGRATQNATTYTARVSEIEVSVSLGSELIGELSSLSKYGDSIELIDMANSLISQSEKLKEKTKNFEIPIGAGIDSFSGFTIYAWKKSYRRFFTEDIPENTFFDYNLIVVDGNSIFYFKGSRNDYFSLSASAYNGIIRNE